MTAQMTGDAAAGKAPAPVGRPAALFVAGPTCSGKSALALALAARLDGVVINADAMQVYAELRILTARPSPAEEALVPHLLYGVRPAAEPGNVAWWRAAALAAITDAHASGKLPILCGGSGMYFHALRHGLADIPPPGPAARAEARALLASLGPAGLHARLATADPATAVLLRPEDSQRLARAWEVWRGTGRGLAAWQADSNSKPAVDSALGRCAAILLDPPRPALRAAIATRFAAMLEAGGLEEVAALLDLGLDPSLPAMRAHGVPELAAVLHGQIGLAEAATRAIAATGRYTRRQATWFRHHLLADRTDLHMINARIAELPQLSDEIRRDLDTFIHDRVDAAL